MTYSLIVLASSPTGKPSTFCSTEKDATSRDDHSKECVEVAGLSWTRSNRFMEAPSKPFALVWH